MKLRQDARELVMLDLSGMGLLIGEVRYNRQTETVLFALERSAFFDLYFPCVVSFDPQRGGPVVQPHIINAMTTSSIRIQRDRVNFFVLSEDIAPAVTAQYEEIISQVTGIQGKSTETGSQRQESSGNGRQKAQKIVDLLQIKGRKKGQKDKK